LYRLVERYEYKSLEEAIWDEAEALLRTANEGAGVVYIVLVKAQYMDIETRASYDKGVKKIFARANADSNLLGLW
jgi:hypothetical protein